MVMRRERARDRALAARSRPVDGNDNACRAPSSDRERLFKRRALTAPFAYGKARAARGWRLCQAGAQQPEWS
jgi:hypothetical protein